MAPRGQVAKVRMAMEELIKQVASKVGISEEQA
jgi:hypothetical protein